jgi:hypothetical protein
MTHLTKRSVDAIRPTGEEQLIRDQILARFYLRITTAGSKIYLIQHKIHGKLRRLTIGTPATMTPERAREEAGKLLQRVELGFDPFIEREERAREEAKRLASRYTVSELIDLWKASDLDLRKDLAKHGLADWATTLKIVPTIIASPLTPARSANS